MRDVGSEMEGESHEKKKGKIDDSTLKKGSDGESTCKTSNEVEPENDDGMEDIQDDEDVSQLKKEDYVEELKRLKKVCDDRKYPQHIDPENRVLIAKLPSAEELIARRNELLGIEARLADKTTEWRENVHESVKENKKYNLPVMKELADR
jgi:hypothetical protein